MNRFKSTTSQPHSEPNSTIASLQRGVFLIELTALIPLLLVVLFAGVQLTSSLGTTQIMGSISREVGNRVSRTCISPSNVVDDSCVAAAVAEVNSYADQELPGTVVSVSVYMYDSSLGAAQLLSFHTHSSPGLTQSRYSASTVPAQLPFILNPLTPVATISEVFYTRPQLAVYAVIEPFIPKDLYEATVF
ncbi:MAG: hypothetical protein KDD60_05255 [Bdellovibrionales bacterium]|nr:hypothetical protein [Bdellovibrionales bacterium]